MDGFCSVYPIGQAGLLRDVTDAVVFLFSEGLSWATGATGDVGSGVMPVEIVRDNNDFDQGILLTTGA